MRWLLCVVCVSGVNLMLAGCDLLFPEFAGNSADAAVVGDGGVEDGGVPILSGVVCVLTDVRDYRTCTAASVGVLRISVEETRDATTTDASGHFSLPLSKSLAIATVGVVDPTNTYAPTVVPVTLASGIANGIALPIFSQQTLQNLELQNGLQEDPSLGIFFGWAVDPSGTPVAGVSTGNNQILYDENAPNTLSPGTATHSDGTVALFAVAPSSLVLTLTPPPTTVLKADTFTVPIRSGAVTASTLVLPPR